MGRALADAAVAADAVIMTAAVADFRPLARVTGKLSRRAVGLEAGVATRPLELTLAPNPDLLADLGKSRRGSRPLLVGFAAEMGGAVAAVARARDKLVEKRCDVMVANDVGVAGIGFGADDNAVTLVFADGRTVALPRAPKLAIAGQIWDHLNDALSGRETAPATVAETTTAAARSGGR